MASVLIKLWFAHLHLIFLQRHRQTKPVDFDEKKIFLTRPNQTFLRSLSFMRHTLVEIEVYHSRDLCQASR